MGWLTSEASFTLAALIVTWAGIVLLGFLATSLHIRLQRLERAGAAAPRPTPYGGMVGQSVATLLQTSLDPEVRALLLLSRSCSSCEKLLDEIAKGGWAAPTAVGWTDGQPERPTLMPPLSSVEGGPAVSRALGVRATPFLVVLGPAGEIVAGGPVNSVRSMKELVARSRTTTPPLPVP